MCCSKYLRLYLTLDIYKEAYSKTSSENQFFKKSQENKLHKRESRENVILIEVFIEIMAKD